MSGLPKWLLAHLEEQGHLVGGVGRRATIRPCADCRQATVTGLDADRCAHRATCDPNPLTARGEAIALIAGRRTYALRRLFGRLELDHRDHWQIRANPAGHPDNRYDVLAEHRCGPSPWHGDLTTATVHQPTTPPLTGDKPPF